MDTSAVKAIVESHIQFMVWDLQVNRWKIYVTYKTLGKGVAGECSPLPAYQSADIVLDPAMFEDEAGVLDTLCHELHHVVTAEWFTVNNLAFEMLNGRDRKTFEAIWRSSMERTVRATEQMLDHGFGIAAGRRVSAGDAAPANPYDAETDGP